MNTGKTLNTLEVHAHEIALKLKAGQKVTNAELQILVTFNKLQSLKR